METGIVKSFDVDHQTLEAGVYLRSVFRLPGIRSTTVNSFDLRCYAPKYKLYLTPGGSHVLEHMLAYWLRLSPQLSDRVIALCPMGCLTGMYLITPQDITVTAVIHALNWVNAYHFPVDCVDDVPGMNVQQCGNPSLNDVDSANKAMQSLVHSVYHLL